MKSLMSRSSRFVLDRDAWSATIALSVFVAVLLVNDPWLEDRLDYWSVWFEGLVALLPVLGLFMVGALRDQPRIYRAMFVGLFLLAMSFLTDVCDEFVDMHDGFNMVFEGAFQVIGFAFTLVGLQRWIRHNQDLTHHLGQLAITDQLTGISNRRHFVSALETESERANRYRSAFSIIMFDIDHFKQINDNHGHHVGDAVLMEVAKRLREQIRKVDVFARYGGEEFVVLTASTSAEDAFRLAEKVRTLLADTHIEPVGQVTASFGVSQYRAGEELHRLLKRADDALYTAKSKGRNQVILHPVH